MFFLLLSRWPIVVASREGGYFLRVVPESPMKGGRYPLYIAVNRVDRDGEKRAAWANATKSAGVLE
jgi:hypothetical protein